MNSCINTEFLVFFVGGLRKLMLHVSAVSKDYLTTRSNRMVIRRNFELQDFIDQYSTMKYE